MIISNKLKVISKDEHGAVAIITALVLLFVLIGIAALAIDIGRVTATKNELQNAADAAALAKASYLYPPIHGEPNWNAAKNADSPINTAAGTKITNYNSDVGYWHLGGNPSNLQENTISPSHDDVPAVYVKAEKKEGKNSGPIFNFFGGLIGSSETEISADGIATTYPPSQVTDGVLFPIAIHEEFAQRWEEDGEGFVIVSSAYHSEDPEEAGQWTSLLTEDNDRPTARDLIPLGNPDPISVGEDIYIQPGTMTSLYGDTESWLQDSPTVDETGKPYRDVVMPVVEGDIDNKSTKEWREITAFVGIRITYAAGGSEKIIQGNFTHTQAGGGGNGGPGDYYGVSISPVIVK